MIKVIMIILMFACIVIVHEWGHYITAKKCGVLVHEFAVGMGPILWSTKKGETVYSIRLLPIGGFCSMEEEVGESVNPRAMAAKKPWQKLLIVSAGAIMNFVLACVLLSIVVGYQGYGSNEIASLEADMPAVQAGLKVGDQIIAIDGHKVERLSDISKVLEKEEKAYTLTVKRGSETFTTPITSKWMPKEERSRLGFSPTFIHFNIWENIKSGVIWACLIIAQVWKAFVDLFTGAVGMNQLSGIVGVVNQSAEIWDTSMQSGGLSIAILNMMTIAAALSANLAVVNLFPLPALDGGRIVFVLVEMLRGKPVPPEKEGAVHFIGFVLLMILTVVLIYNDFMRISL
ncbi:M50 family metallopeptidase [Cellulosilyticum sp. ST5]|uniref:M50 family metallopeptidase n=1 Tax=unclassified Cellulosilyticum TaxID=2643091 RepID=UPI000F8CCB65|nr:M50 family metallopeptidase [Cellulosilyticum sp. WCF-2]QEH69573.1 site-2 protease family protein [Cellulosilyticum sp. WCF-2]